MPAPDKKHLRAVALGLRHKVSRSKAEAFSQRLSSEGLEFAQRNKSHCVSLYNAIMDEANPSLLLEALAGASFKTCLPISGQRSDPLIFRQWRPGEAQILGQMKIMEPAPIFPVCEPDLLFIPLAAFDRRLHRIGYGAGFYDRTLAWLRSQRATIAIGIAYACQEVARVPYEPHDQRLDFVLTEKEWIG